MEMSSLKTTLQVHAEGVSTGRGRLRAVSPELAEESDDNDEEDDKEYDDDDEEEAFDDEEEEDEHGDGIFFTGAMHNILVFLGGV